MSRKNVQDLDTCEVMNQQPAHAACNWAYADFDDESDPPCRHPTVECQERAQLPRGMHIVNPSRLDKFDD